MFSIPLLHTIRTFLLLEKYNTSYILVLICTTGKCTILSFHFRTTLWVYVYVKERFFEVDFSSSNLYASQNERGRLCCHIFTILQNKNSRIVGFILNYAFRTGFWVPISNEIILLLNYVRRPYGRFLQILTCCLLRTHNFELRTDFRNEPKP